MRFTLNIVLARPFKKQFTIRPGYNFGIFMFYDELHYALPGSLMYNRKYSKGIIIHVAMIIIHAVQKLLNISRLKPALYISERDENQELHSWYAKLTSTGFPGKLLVMYVHEPSLILVLTKGKTISGTLPEFYDRLPYLLKRNAFNAEFIDKELLLIREGCVLSKTNSKSMLASMNAITKNIEYRCRTFNSYEAIDVSRIEDSYMNWLTYDPTKPGQFRRTIDFWKKKGLILSPD